MSRNSIEALANQIELLHTSIDELTTAFEHAIRNGVVKIDLQIQILDNGKPESGRGNGNEQNDGAASVETSPAPDRLF